MTSLMTKMKNNAKAMFFVLFFLGTMVFFGGLADQAKAVDFNLRCSVGDPCSRAYTIFFSADPTITVYRPGQQIDIGGHLSSDDHPVQQPFNPSLRVQILNIVGANTGDLIPWAYSAQDLRSGQDVSVSSGLNAPLTRGQYTLQLTLAIAQSHTGWDYQAFPPSSGQFTVPITVVAGTVNVTSNIAGASYTITGPATLRGSGLSTTFTNQPTGTYTITWNSVAGYTTPTSSAFALTDGGTINFSKSYTSSVPTINVHF